MLAGAAFNLLLTPEDKTNMRKIEKHFEREIPEVLDLIFCIASS